MQALHSFSHFKYDFEVSTATKYQEINILRGSLALGRGQRERLRDLSLSPDSTTYQFCDLAFPVIRVSSCFYV